MVQQQFRWEWNYTVTVTDGNGCIASTSVVITEPTPLTSSFTNTNVKCFGGSTGSSTVNVAGGTPPYTYLWTPGNYTTQTITNLTQGTDTVHIKDANGCVKIINTTITQPTGMTLTETHIPANCNLSNGSATVAVAGGTGPYTYSWSTLPTAQTTITASALAANTYVVTVKDSNACTQTLPVDIPNIAGPTASIFSSTDVSCFGLCDGTAVSVVNGGTNPYTFSWSNGQVSPTATNLCAGSYTLTATDVHGCIASTSVTITQPAVLSSTLTATDPKCFNNTDGSILNSTTGGTTPYTYLWTPTGATTPGISNLSFGVYSVDVKDAHGCTVTPSATLVNPAAIVAAVVTTDVTCFGLCNGILQVNPSAGTGPYTYQWNDANNQTTQTASGICAGNYNIIVKDAHGCIGTSPAVINSPPSLSAIIPTWTNVTCFGSADGTIDVVATGGAPGYTYNWMPGNTAGANVNNLSAGPTTAGLTYTVTVTDANGCRAQAQRLIIQPSQLIATIVSTDITCYGTHDGTATADYSGGTGPFTFAWNPGNAFDTTNFIINVGPGAQVLTVKDANGCTVISQATIVEPTVLAVTTTTTNSDCGFANGQACGSITGGSPPFQYVWNNPGLDSTACTLGVNAGVYTLTITDSHSCSDTVYATVNDNQGPTVAIPTVTNVTCAGANNGSAQGTISGGVLPYLIQWFSNPVNPPSTTTFANNLSGGNYVMQVKDSLGCISSVQTAVQEPLPLKANIIESFNVKCFLDCNGWATVNAGDGTPPYTYMWSDVNNDTTATALGLCSQTYQVTVTDVHGCAKTINAPIGTPQAITITLVSKTDVKCYGDNTGQIIIQVSNGTPGYTYNWTSSTGANAGSSPQVTNLHAGTYTLVVTDKNQCQATQTFTITESPQIMLSTISNQSTCGLANGFVSVSPTGGVSPYTYFWTPTNQQTAIATSLLAGTYSVTVTDNLGCKADTSVALINVPGPTNPIPLANMSFTRPGCSGAQTGTATINVAGIGGTNPYTFLWDDINTQITATASALVAGTYHVLVKDGNGCPAIGTVTISQPNPLVVIPVPNDTICVGQFTQIYGIAFGGTQGYNYFWTPPNIGTNPIVSPVVTSNYSVYATDANSCISPTQTITVFVRPPVNVIATDTAVCAQSCVPISAAATGGLGTYTYSWSNGAGLPNQSVCPLSSQNYWVMVNDHCSPVVYDTSHVLVRPLPVTFPFVTDTVGCQPFTVAFTAQSDIGTGFTWNFGDGTLNSTSNLQNPTYTYPNVGSFMVTLTTTTINNCVSVKTYPNYIDVIGSPIADFRADPTTVTTTAPLVNFTDMSSGATTWAWNFDVPFLLNDTSSVQNPSYSYADSGHYDVQLVVTNASGCSATVTHPIVVAPDYVFFAPNAFTPNNHDGVNDTFMPKFVGVDPNNFEMVIFDRWGNLIFKTTDVHKGWDGKANGGGKPVQIDVYVWKVSTDDFLGNKHQYMGHVSVVK
jgi:gliding motility-associated-like protein